MASTRHVVLTAGFLGLGVIGMGMLAHGGRLVVPRHEQAALSGADAAVHGELERTESFVPAGRGRDDGLWRAYIDLVGKELEQGRVDVAVRVWQDAYGAAVESGRWEGMLAVGDAFLAIGRAAGTPRGARMNAREAYMAALIRARRDRSVDGTLRVAGAFQRLDDRAVVAQCLHIAADLAAGNEGAQQRVREARQRWAEGEPIAPSGQGS